MSIDHDASPYPHPGGCATCRERRFCNFCGESTRGDSGRCTNGRCSACHREQCTPGGATSPGHGYGNNAPHTLQPPRSRSAEGVKA